MAVRSSVLSYVLRKVHGLGKECSSSEMKVSRHYIITKIVEGWKEETIRQHFGFTKKQYKKFCDENFDLIVERTCPEFIEL